ncbi:NHL repeat protein [Leptospira ryugenii]|uniref:NHL repeat protein n=1 Tax=Leptospira ryugenii TaxID=1917863 RepID=A0A2P2DX27_9LEPT|nr:6-bladed beta-propeller [Leptospira ryugenii]GBF49195.1 NHL repeat protein [Leptospira ryugenii]
MIRFLSLFLLLLTTQILSIDFPNFTLLEEAAREEFKRGLTYKNLRQYSAAKERLQKAIQLKKDFHLARLELANNYYLLGEWEQALEELEILSSLRKNDLLIQSKIEVLRLAIAGGSTSLERIYFKSIEGDALRHNRFRNPSDITFDSLGNFYIAGFGTSNIIKFNSDGAPIANWKGSFRQKIEKPVALANYQDHLYVCDFARDEILEFDQNGSLVRSIGGSGNQNGKFHGPSGIAFDEKGSFYVSDSGNNRIQKFNSRGEFEISFGQDVRFALKNPAGLSFYKNQIYVADKDNKRILIFDTDGNTKGQIKKSEWEKPRSLRIIQNQLYVSDEISGIWSYGLDGGEWKQNSKFRDQKGVYRILTRPFSVNIDSTNTFYAVDYARHRVDIFTDKNTLLSNLDLRIESIDTSDFPNVHLYTRLRNRSGEELIGVDRLAFRVYENDNMTPLFSLARRQKLNERMKIALVFENSKTLEKSYSLLSDSLQPFFSSITDWDDMSLYRSGKDSVLILPNTQSKLDILAKIRDTKKENNFNFGKSGFQALSKLSTHVGPKALIYLVSDEAGEQGFLQYSKTRLVEFAKSHMIPIYVLYVGKNLEKKQFWSDLTEPTGGKWILLDGEGEERDLYQSLRNHFDNRYILSYKTDISPDLVNRYIKLVVDVEHRNVKGKDEAGYFVPAP